jgi:protein phosphatase
MTPEHACPYCRAVLPRGVANCPQCGASLAELLEMPEPAAGGVVAAETLPLAAAASAAQEGEVVAGYPVVQRYALRTCTFYQVTDPQGANSYLLRRTPRTQALSAELQERLRRLARQDLPHVLPHEAIEADEENSYVLLRHPGGGWRSLALAPAPLPQALAAELARQAGEALQGLAARGLGHYPPGLAGREGFIVDQQNALYLADLSLCLPLRQGEQASARPLASLLYYLATGQDIAGDSTLPVRAPEGVHAVIEQALGGQTLDGFVEALGASARPPSPATPQRELRQLVGSATDAGNRRDHNEDWVAALSYTLDRTGLSLPLGLYIVADGMGGYAGGEHASSSGIRQPLMRFIEQEILPDLQNETRRLTPEVTPEGKLQAMVRLANERVYENRQSSGGERGSTMTAALIMGSACVVANVGDSRTYLFRDGRLSQISEDHSLVARLVKAGEIQPEEVYTHRQRNKVYRSLGDRPDTPVDTFPLDLQPSDRLLLCSDGLWEMVRDPQLAAILAENPNPQMACDVLVAAANENGGEDNISAIVVDVL